MSEWINTSDRLPEEGQRVIFAIGPGRNAYQYQCADFAAGNVFEYTGGVINAGAVDYWMPLPALPQGSV